MTQSRFALRPGPFVGLVSAILVSLFSGSATLQASLEGLNWNENKAASYGYLWQYSLAPPLGAAACGPAATTNAFTFLQNTQGERIGNQLTGDDYDSWKTTAETLANDYMQTGGVGSTNGGTKYWNLATGMQQYAQHKHKQYPDRTGVRFDGVFVDPQRDTGGMMPKWVKLQDKGPTLEQLYEMLAGGAGVVMGMNFGLDLGHIVTLADMDWDDQNKNGIVDLGEATLSVIDPLDPSSNVENGKQGDPYGKDERTPQRAMFTTLDVWQTTTTNPETGEPVSVLAIAYQQYHGSDQPSGGHYGPYDSHYGKNDLYITAAFSMRAVPEPASVLVWSTLVLGVTLTRRRRSP